MMQRVLESSSYELHSSGIYDMISPTFQLITQHGEQHQQQLTCQISQGQ